MSTSGFFVHGSAINPMKILTEHIGTGSQRERLTRLLLFCMVICFVTNLASYMRIPVLPLMATSLGADSVRVGLINSAFMLSAGLLSVPAGLLSDRIGRRKLITWGLLILSGSSFLLYGSSDLLQMAAAYLLFGAGLAAFTPTLLSHVVDITPPERLGVTYGLYSAVLHCGLTIGPAAGGFLGRAVGLRQVFLVSGSLILFMFLFAMAVLPRDTQHRSAAGEPTAYWVLWREMLRNRALLACLVTSFGFSISTGVFSTFIPLFLHDLGMNAGHVGLVFAGQALANGFSRIPLGRLADRFHRCCFHHTDHSDFSVHQGS